MVHFNLLASAVLGAGASLVAAAPLAATQATPALKRSSCTFTEASQVSESAASCASIVLSSIAVPAGSTLDLTNLKEGSTVTFEGTTTFGYKEWSGPLIELTGTDITITGASGHEINGNGASWWDGEGSNGGKTKPTFFMVNNLKDSTIENLNIKNTPIQCFAIDSANNVNINNVTIDDSAGTANGMARNTDAFDVDSSTGLYITGANVNNQDDCLAINSGSDISFTGGTCTGGHGLSIGSVGGRSDNTVENIQISDNTISDSMNGVRIKTISGDSGTVKNVTYSDITLSGITEYGIVIEQDYENGDPTGVPTNGISISDLTISNVKGTVASGASQVYILCGSGSCSDWTWSDVSVTGGAKSSKCENMPSAASGAC